MSEAFERPFLLQLAISLFLGRSVGKMKNPSAPGGVPDDSAGTRLPQSFVDGKNVG